MVLADTEHFCSIQSIAYLSIYPTRNWYRTLRNRLEQILIQRITREDIQVLLGALRQEAREAHRVVAVLNYEYLLFRGS